MPSRPSLPSSDEQLLAECEVETFRASGKGGQHVNVTDSAVRMTHLPTGIVVTAREERSQYQNKQICLRKIREKFAFMNRRRAKRIPTKRPRAAKEEILQKKARASQKKRLRSKPRAEE